MGNKQENNENIKNIENVIDKDVSVADDNARHIERVTERVIVRNNNAEDTIDILGIFENAGKAFKKYVPLGAMALSAGILLGAVVNCVPNPLVKDASSSAVISFSFAGIEQGLAPDGTAFDINKLKNSTVISEALENAGIDSSKVESVRQNIEIKEVVPESVVNQKAVYQEMAAKDVEYYENLLSIDYHPNKYIVSLKCDSKSWSEDENNQILDAVLDAYIDWFSFNYTDTAVLSNITVMKDTDSYEYAENIDTLENEITTMVDYLSSIEGEAAGFRSAETGYSIRNLEEGLKVLRDVDLARLSSYVTTHGVVKDKNELISFYEYRIRQLEYDAETVSANMLSVDNQLAGYSKDPIVIFSGTDSSESLGRTNDYYDDMIARKVGLEDSRASISSQKLVYEDLISRYSNGSLGSAADAEYVDAELAKIKENVEQFAALTETTVKEYYETSVLSNAVKVAVPAKLSSAHTFGSAIKMCGMCGGGLLAIVIVIWLMDGLITELKKGRSHEEDK